MPFNLSNVDSGTKPIFYLALTLWQLLEKSPGSSVMELTDTTCDVEEQTPVASTVDPGDKCKHNIHA